MRRILCLFAVILAHALGVAGQAVNTINTVAGGGAEPNAAAGLYLPQPNSAVRDSAGNTFISVPALQEVLKVDTSGNATVYAGTGVGGFSGDGGPATSAQLSFPYGLAIDKSGTLFIADLDNNRIRRVDATTHNITTVAGSDDPYSGGYAGDGGLATLARLNSPQDVAVDANDDLFIADTGNGLVREVNGNTQIISTYAGGGSSFGCPSGPASTAGFVDPIGIAVDGNGNVFVADLSLDVVCKVDSSQNISPYAGTLFTPGIPGQPNGDGGSATSATLLSPNGVATDSTGNLYIADSGDPKIRKVDTTTNHIITTVAGIGLICTNAEEPTCGDGGAATSAEFNYPQGVSVDSSGNIVVADTDNMRVRVINTASPPTVASFAGGGTGGDGGPGTSAVLGLSQSVAVDSSENVYEFDAAGEKLRELNAKSGDLSTVAGNGYGGATEDCSGTTCGRAINGDGGPATQARFVAVLGVATDSSGNLYFVDYNAEVVRVVNMQSSAITIAGVTVEPGEIETVAGNGLKCGASGNSNPLPTCGDGGSATSASLYHPHAVAVDTNSNIYIADAGLNTVRIVNNSGTISTFAGTPGQTCMSYITSNCGDEGSATSALLNFPAGVATYLSGENTFVYIADAGDNVIREVNAGQTISTVAFSGFPTFGGDDGSALLASMNFPEQVAVDNLGNLFVGGGYDNVVQRIDASDQSVATVAGDVNNLDGGFSHDGGPSTQAMIENFGLAIFNTANSTHDLFIADSGSNRIRRVNLAPVTIESGSLTAFGPTVAGSTSTLPQFLDFANDGLDDLILKATISGSPAFTLSCGTTCPYTISPGSAGEITVSFNPPVGVSGTLTGMLTITTNDAANPSFSYSLTGTVSAPVALTVTISPSGGGIVLSTDGSISCPTTCTANYATGSTVSLVAGPNSGYAFSSWSGACTGTIPACNVTMSGAEAVTANFVTSTAATTYTLTVNPFGNGSGTITSTPAGISCTITNGVAGTTGCSATFPVTTTASLAEAPSAANGSTFAGWLNPACTTLSTTCSYTAEGGGTVVAAPVFSGPAQPFASGQVFLSTARQMVFVYSPTGAVVQVLPGSSNEGAQGNGMTFDSVGNLYEADAGDQYVVTYSNKGVGPTNFENPTAVPYSVLQDPFGNILLGESSYNSDSNPAIQQFSSDGGAVSATYYPGYDQDFPGSFWFELLDNNDTVAYTLGDQTVKLFDLDETYQHPDLSTTMHGAFALRELPDKSLLVADTDRIARLDTNGNLIQTYTISGTSAYFTNLNLDPDGATFWTDDQLSGTVYRINISTGAVVSQFPTNLGIAGLVPLSAFGGLAVYGQPASGGADVSVTMTAQPNPVNQNSNLTYTVLVVNNGPLAAENVVLTDTLPAGATFVSASSTPVGTCSGTTTITCTFGTLTYPDGTSATVTIVVTATEAGTLTNTVNVTSTTPDPDLANNTATTSTTVNQAAAPLEITTTSLPGGVVGSPYSATLMATGGTTPYAWRVNTGALPPGLSLSSVGGISGTPTTSGSYPFEVAVTDSSSPVETATAELTMTVTGVAAAAALSITKTHSGNFTQGQANATYTVTVSDGANSAPTSGTVTVTDTIPSGMTLASMAGTGWTCSFTTCTRDDVLAAGSSYPAITVTVDVDSDASSPQVNLVIVSGGGSASAKATDSTTIASGTPPLWILTGNLNTGRSEQTETLLPNGNVLIAGGGDVVNGTFTPIGNPELYNPTAGTFTSAGTMTSVRSSHTATLLGSGAGNGNVLLAGGFLTNGSNVTNTAELYNPATGTFTPTNGTMTTPRFAHTATLLPNGQVLLTGGKAGSGAANFLSSAELYDPTTGKFTATTGSMSVARAYHTATLLSNGLVLIAGGKTGGGVYQATAELYNPSTGMFMVIDSDMSSPRAALTATLLGDGTVLLAGGGFTDSGAITVLNTADIYNPSTNTFSPTEGTMTVARAFHSATALPDGTVLIAGGADSSDQTNGKFAALASAEVYHPATGLFSEAASLNNARAFFGGGSLQNGTVLASGGFTGTNAIDTVLATAELYNAGITAPIATLSASLLGFYNQPINSISANQTVTLTNTGNANLVVTAISGTQETPFNLASGSCLPTTAPVVLMPGLSCQLNINFAPTATGTFNASVSFTDNATPSTQTLLLTGTAAASGGTATLKPVAGSTLSFGNVTDGTISPAMTVTITNTGTTPLGILNIGNTPPNNFMVNSNCPSSLTPSPAAGSSCTVSAYFEPSGTGTETSTLNISTTDPVNPVQALTLTGTAVPATSRLSLVKSHIGNFTAGQTGATYTVTVSNGADAEATSGAVTVTENPPSGLTVTGMAGSGWTCTTTSCTRSDALQGGTSYPQITVTVNVASNATSPQVNFVTVSGGGSASATAKDSTTIVSSSGSVSLSTTSLNFNDQVMTITSSPQMVTLTNSGTGPLNITAVAPNGDYAQTNTCLSASPLSPQGTCTITVTFTPTALGTRPGSIAITDSAANSPQSISLTGVGTMVGLATAPGGSTTVTVDPGGTAVYGLMLVTPEGTTGTAQLGCTSPDATITCSVVPPTVKLTGKTVETAVVVNSYCTAGTAPVGTPINRLLLLWLVALGALAVLTLGRAPAAERRRLALAVAPALLAAVLIVSAACGKLPKNPAGATQPGTYQLNITATLDNSSFTMPVTLIVK
jgi:uncharacterized repeat protein (TIGR01451 family)